jgi:hypothetical protein
MLTSELVISYEVAAEESENLTNKEAFYVGKTEIFKGDHPNWGRVYIVIDVTSESVVLPIVIQ